MIFRVPFRDRALRLSDRTQRLMNMMLVLCLLSDGGEAVENGDNKGALLRLKVIQESLGVNPGDFKKIAEDAGELSAWTKAWEDEAASQRCPDCKAAAEEDNLPIPIQYANEILRRKGDNK